MSESPVHPPEQLGERLRQARLAAGLSISDLATLTHVRSIYLTALEEGHYDELPEDVYSRNFVRLFALNVGLPVESTLASYQQERRAALGANTLDQRLEHDRATASALRRGVSVPATTPPNQPFGSYAWLPGLLTHPWVLAGVLGVALLTLAGWGLQSLFSSSPNTSTRATSAIGATNGAGANNPSPSTSAGTPAASGPVIDLLEPPESVSSSGPVAEAGAVEVVLVDILSTPEGATVTIDGFVLPGQTPLTRVPLTPRNGRVVAVELAGYQGLQTTLDLVEDRRLAFTLAADTAPTEGTPPGVNEIVFSITEASWFEVWQSNNRNQGERLAYTTAQPGAEYRFNLPVYVHVGNAAGVRVNLAGQDLGPLGSPGTVLGRPFGN